MTEVHAEKIMPHEWRSLEEISHRICFSEFRPSMLNKHHFVVGGFINKELSGYFTCLEMDAETAYIQYGGAFPNHEKSVYVIQGYHAMLGELEKEYKRVWTRIENTNKAMMKLAIQSGFLVVGTYNFKGKTFVELELEFLNEGE